MIKRFTGAIMRIAHFVSNFPNNNNNILYGKSVSASNLCISLADRGHDVYAFLPSEDRRSYVNYYKGVRVFRYRSLFGYRSERFSPELYYKPMGLDIDLIHIHSGISLSVLSGLNCAVKKKLPLVVTWHGDSIKEYGRYEGKIAGSAAYAYKKYIANRILTKANIIISPSDYYVRESLFISKYKEKIRVIPNGIYLNEFDIHLSKEECKQQLGLAEKKVILFVGGLYALKGPDVLMKAASQIIKKHKDAIFIFLGEGDLEKYRELSRKLGIDDYVRFPGYIFNEIIIYYRASDIFVLPSYREMFPMVLLEASASELPLVVSDLNTLRCIVRDNYNGIFAGIGDEKKFADAINYLLDNEAYCRQMGKNARESVKGYSWSRVAKATEDVYKSLIDKDIA